MERILTINKIVNRQITIYYTELYKYLRIKLIYQNYQKKLLTFNLNDKISNYIKISVIIQAIQTLNNLNIKLITKLVLSYQIMKQNSLFFNILYHKQRKNKIAFKKTLNKVMKFISLVKIIHSDQYQLILLCPGILKHLNYRILQLKLLNLMVWKLLYKNISLSLYIIQMKMNKINRFSIQF